MPASLKLLTNSTLTGGKANVDGKFQWANTSIKPEPGQQYEVVFTPSDTGKYSTVSCKVSVTVNQPVTEPEIPTIPETPPVYAEKVSLNRTSLTLETGKTFMLTASISPANAANQTVVWRSSNTSVAIVSNGTVTGVSEGGATITASCGNVSASCNVIVKGCSTQTQPQGVHFDRVTVYFQNQFQDVPANQWYTDSVSEAFELGLMAGTSETTFMPG